LTARLNSPGVYFDFFMIAALMRRRCGKVDRQTEPLS
jgi:hypothetical protein